jgi:hypothetical protein
MGGGGFVGGALPAGAEAWCTGDDVIGRLNDLFDQNPKNQQYKDAKAASLDLFQKAATSGDWNDLWTAYVEAYGATTIALCGGWQEYLEALGTLSSNSNNSGSIVTTSSTATSSAILTFGNVPDWMADDLTVSDSSTPGAIIGGQTVSDFTATTVTLTANVNATVNAGDTIVFALPSRQGPSNIKAIAQARYQGLKNDKKMKTHKHGPHEHHSSGHRVKVTHESDGSITITSPYIPPGGALRNRNRKP